MFYLDLNKNRIIELQRSNHTNFVNGQQPKKDCKEDINQFQHQHES